MKCPKCKYDKSEYKEMCLKCGYPIKSISVPGGGRIHFGKYDWLVLEKQKDKMLILSEKILEKRSYHNVEMKVTWETSSIRNYLNNEFYFSFEDNERSRLYDKT